MREFNKLKAVVFAGCLASVATGTLARSAQAGVDACSLSQRVFAGYGGISVGASAVELDQYQNKLNKECQLQRQYQTLQTRAAQFGISLENISVFQALRFIGRSYYIQARYNDTPVPLIYQRRDSMYELPIEQRSDEIWLNFQTGISQLEGWRRRVMEEKHALTLDDLKVIHSGFYQKSDETGDHSREPHPGDIKPPYKNDIAWWWLDSDEERQRVQQQVESANAYYRDLGLIPNVVSGEGEFIGDPMIVKKVNDKWGVFSGDSNASVAHMRNLLGFMNGMMKQARSGGHMIWRQGTKTVMMTPAELAFVVQQYFVSVHPFYEGNGRISRFLQELILTSFGLPPGSSGDLMANDALTASYEYYQLGIEKTGEQIEAVGKCLDSYSSALAWQSGRLRDVDAAKLEYDCRLL